MCLLCAYATRMVSGWPMSRGPAASGLAASEESTSTLQLDTKEIQPLNLLKSFAASLQLGTNGATPSDNERARAVSVDREHQQLAAAHAAAPVHI